MPILNFNYNLSWPTSLQKWLEFILGFRGKGSWMVSITSDVDFWMDVGGWPFFVALRLPLVLPYHQSLPIMQIPIPCSFQSVIAILAMVPIALFWISLSGFGRQRWIWKARKNFTTKENTSQNNSISYVPFILHWPDKIWSLKLKFRQDFFQTT